MRPGEVDQIIGRYSKRTNNEYQVDPSFFGKHAKVKTYRMVVLLVDEFSRKGAWFRSCLRNLATSPLKAWRCSTKWQGSPKMTSRESYILWMDEIHFGPPKKPWNDDSPANTSKQCFPVISKWCRISSIHSSTVLLDSFKKRYLKEQNKGTQMPPGSDRTPGRTQS